MQSKMDLINECEHFAYQIGTNLQLIDAYMSTQEQGNKGSNNLLNNKLR